MIRMHRCMRGIPPGHHDVHADEQGILHHPKCPSYRRKERTVSSEDVLEKLKRRQRYLESQVKENQEMLDRVQEAILDFEAELAERPVEPPVDAVIAFVKAFNGKDYSWVAYQAVPGRWFLSQDGTRGAQLPSMTWNGLLDFVDGNTMYWATGWEVWS